MKFNPVALIGFMGSGKTTIGRAVAFELSAEFSDLDTQIEIISGLRIPDIHSEMGEDGLRQFERLALSNIVAFGSVIATNASCIMIPRNRMMIEDNFKVFYLETGFDVLYPRIAGTARPLLKSLTKIELEKLFDLRRPLYESCADFVLDASRPVDALVNEILDRIVISV